MRLTFLKASRGFLILLITFLLAAPALSSTERNGSVIERYNELKKKSLQTSARGGFTEKDFSVDPAALERATGEKASGSDTSPVRVVTGGSVEPTVPGTASGRPALKLGVKIWGEVRDGPDAGKKFNLASHIWKPRERFYVWIESAVPVQLSLLQLYPDENRKPKQVVPSLKRPKDFQTIPAGIPYRLPIPLITDNDTNEETMSVVVASAASGQLPINTDPEGWSGDGETVVKTLERTREKLFQLNEEATAAEPSATKGGIRRKFEEDTPDDAPESSTDQDEVATYYVGHGPNGRFEIRLRKTK